ncbi:MAG TPA: MoaD/ThiS family protein [Phycisphaerales bacterium]|nr:MoaD/ThiS family protein [Phycisphaerales bacterium]
MNDKQIIIDVRYFAVLADRIGLQHERLELPCGAVVADAIDVLSDTHDVIAELRGSLATAIGRDYVPPDCLLVSHTELSLIPPVSGG